MFAIIAYDSLSWDRETLPLVLHFSGFQQLKLLHFDLRPLLQNEPGLSAPQAQIVLQEQTQRGKRFFKILHVYLLHGNVSQNLLIHH